MRLFATCLLILAAASSAVAQSADPGVIDTVRVDTASFSPITGKAVLNVTLVNDELLSGLQIPLQFANDLVILDSVVFGARTLGFTGDDILRADTNLGGTSNTVTLVVVPLQTGTIAIGSDVIASLYISRNGGSSADTALVTDTIVQPAGGLLLADTASATYGFRPQFEAGVVRAGTAVGDDPTLLPMAYDLSQNYPNPFNPSTAFRVSLPVASHVTLDVFNLLGQRVTRLYDAPAPAGYLDIVWDGRDDHGRQVGSGVYFYRVLAGDFRQVRKMVLLK